MAGLTVHIGSNDRNRIDAAADRIRFFGEAKHVISTEGFSAAWVGHDNPRLFGPATDPVTGIHVLTSGRAAWDEAEWSRAERMAQYEGGLGNRLLLDRYLRQGAAALNRPNGPCALVVWDPRTRVVHLWTDHFGYHPVFLYKPDRVSDAIIGTFPDAIADDPSVTTTLDLTSVAEFLSAWRITPPHTYYKEIRYAGAASHGTWDLTRGTYRQSTYWRPHSDSPFPTADAAAEELADAVRAAIHIRTLDRLAPVVCFISGGMDSRTVLFAAADAKNVIGVNLYDEPNHEAHVARRLCDAAGVRYVGFQRDTDYYPRWLSEGVRLSGAMWSHEDDHYLGTRGRLMELGAATVISGCTTDWLFKGYGLEKTYRRFVGRNLPLKRFQNLRLDGFVPNVPRTVPPRFAAEVRGRLDDWFEGTPKALVTAQDRLAVEDRRVRPACYAVSVSGQIMYRIFPYDTFLADSRVADCYARCRPEWKLNADVWGKAVARICWSGQTIEDANFGWSVGASTVSRLLSFSRAWIGRRLNPAATVPDGLATQGSWPNLGWYAKNSATLQHLWATVGRDAREVVTDAWGSDPWKQPIENWSGKPNDLFRILTVARYLDVRRLGSGAVCMHSAEPLRRGQ